MSVLSFPRIYFKGYIGWDPCTFNNNDWQTFPTYDATNAAPVGWQAPHPAALGLSGAARLQHANADAHVYRRHRLYSLTT